MSLSSLFVLGAAAGLTACAAPSDQAAVSDAGLNAYASVARRVYAGEQRGTPVHASLRRISRDAAAMRGNRAELLRQLFLPHYHVVRLRVVRGGRVVNDVGGRFVVAGPSRRGMTISIQDAIGYVKLVHRLTGVGIVVRGRPGHVAASSPALAKASLPSSGDAAVAGRRYAVTSFSEPGFAGERLRVWIVGQPA
ncbi:hypothetical protein [Candidatus Solirubrobacter pratensis]|uniref:hypothetical protein n=1 Tax=Candidatus Solirubrobacter pratensis TaxID=1298857 RepID=UPI000482D3B8|nr:hypothetical protein [Candidatus Solirubrobacter pratensis]